MLQFLNTENPKRLSMYIPNEEKSCYYLWSL